jgi:hypothetical protein
MEKDVKTKDPMQEMVRIFVPRIPGENKTQYVAINGKAWNIPCDEYWEVPKPVADIVMASQHNARLAREYSEAQQQAGKTAVAPDGSRIQI